MKTSIFKTYDIRGVVPEELDKEAIEKISFALVQYLKLKSVVLGYDARLSSPEFAEAAKKVFLSHGVKVYELKMVPIEVLYFACGHLKADAGMMITASHNPREYNGVKLIRENAKPLTSGSGLEEIKKIAFEEKDINIDNNQKGELNETDLWPQYLEKTLSFIDREKIKPIKIVCDTSNGVGGRALEEIASKIPLEIIKLNFEPDGNFPGHEPNPLIAENRKQIIDECQKHSDIALGAIFDGDSDRVAFVTEKGEFIDTDFISALIVKILLNKFPGQPVVFDMRRGWAIKDQSEILGSKFYPAKSGYPFIKEKMRQVNAIFGGEASAHYFYRDFFFSDSSIITLLLLIEFLSKNNLTISMAIEEYTAGYFMFEETNFTVNNAERVIKELKKEFSDGKISELDGLSVDYDLWHFNLRRSSTQPLVRLNIEGKDPQLIEEKRDTIMKIIYRCGGMESDK